MFAGSGWTPSRSTLAEHREPGRSSWSRPSSQYHDPAGPAGYRRRHRRHELPDAAAENAAGGDSGDDARTGDCWRRWPKRKAKGDPACWPRCGSTRACIWRLTTSSTSACRGIAMAPTTSSGTAAASCKGIVSRETRSVVLHSDERLTFAACWGHARRKVVEATTYQPRNVNCSWA